MVIVWIISMSGENRNIIEPSLVLQLAGLVIINLMIIFEYFLALIGLYYLVKIIIKYWRNKIESHSKSKIGKKLNFKIGKQRTLLRKETVKISKELTRSRRSILGIPHQDCTNSIDSFGELEENKTIKVKSKKQENSASHKNIEVVSNQSKVVRQNKLIPSSVRYLPREETLKKRMFKRRKRKLFGIHSFIKKPSLNKYHIDMVN